jgi:hypothetical protein
MDVFVDEFLNDENDLVFMAYDNYNVNAQGLNHRIRPHFYNNSIIYEQRRILSAFSEECGVNHNTAYNQVKKESFYHNDLDWTNPISSNDKMFFYIEGDNSGYFRSENSNFSFTDGIHSYDDPVSNAISYSGNLTSTTIDNESFYIEEDNRIGKGNHVEFFTNYQVRNKLSECILRGFIEVPGFDRSDTRLCPDDGIGAYTVTTVDGRNYHYSLPVYQREIFTEKYDNSEFESFYLSCQLQPYAYEWLLTAITGPDYVDIIATEDEPGLDDQDLGYWIMFDYGKWTDSYIWSNPFNQVNNEPYMWGRKEIYYLDFIRTASHTAYFVKSIREDGIGKSINKVYDSNDSFTEFYLGEERIYGSIVPTPEGHDPATRTAGGRPI